jgi:hypothetical protein
MGRINRTVGELKAILDQRGIDYSKCCEKCELEALVEDNISDASARNAAEYKPTSTATVRHLKAELLARGVDFSQCCEKQELQKLLRQSLDHQRGLKALKDAGFAVHLADGSRCCVDIADTARSTECICYWEDGTSTPVPWNELEPLEIHLSSRLSAYDGSFEDARARAFREQKILVTHVHSAQRCAAENFQELVLASEDVSSLLIDNAIFWRGCPGELKPTHAQMIAPLGSATVAMVLPLAVDAMRVLSILPRPSKDMVMNAFVDALEALDEHHTAAEARLFSEDALLRREQEEEFAEALAIDQGSQNVEIVEEGSETNISEEACAKIASSFEFEEDLNTARHRLAEEFLNEHPPTGSTARLVLRFPGGERVERAFSANTLLSRVYAWAQCCALLPEASGSKLSVPASFELSTSFPPRRLGPEMVDKTLTELGLAPSAALLVIERDD